MFVKYQHVERWGHAEVEGINIGTCYVFPKIDGANGSVWLDANGEVNCGSRKRHLTLMEDNQGFMNHIALQQPIRDLLNAYPNWRLYGEWLVPHTLKTYREDAWRKFYVFDVTPLAHEDDWYIPYQQYKEVLDRFGVNYVPCIAVVHDGTVEQFHNIAERNDYLMKPGEIGEGIVIKNYAYANRYGRQTWAKIVRSEFKEANQKHMGAPVIQGATMVERAIAVKYTTKTLVDKERAKIENAIEDDVAAGKKRTPIQPRLLSTVHYCILKEELPDIVKRWKNPTIDFGLFQRCVYDQIKLHAPDLF